MHALFRLVGVSVLFATVNPIHGQTPSPKRGEQILTSRALTISPWTPESYRNLWKVWDSKSPAPPAEYEKAVQTRYGLHPAPYPNQGIPMGLREAPGLLGKYVAPDCMLCHGGSIFGKSYVGLGNSSLDIHALFEDLNQSSGLNHPLPFTFSNVRGTSEAGAMAVYLWSYRNPDLSIRLKRHAFQLKEDLCEDVPAWWLLKKKKTMYYTGSTPAESVRSIMQFMLSPLNNRKFFEKQEADFRDIHAFILAMESPKYPFAVDENLAKKGHHVFRENCAKCHGTYAPDTATYPNKIIELKVIGTDPKRYNGIAPEVGKLYNDSWFAEDGKMAVVETEGYQAPPLDGIWATAPYFHNGSVPTLEGVLNSKARPSLFTRTYRTDEDAYDKDRLGWKIESLKTPPTSLTPLERRKIYDTTQPGRSNAGHTFGDSLTAEERRAILEYLKTL